MIVCGNKLPSKWPPIIQIAERISKRVILILFVIFQIIFITGSILLIPRFLKRSFSYLKALFVRDGISDKDHPKVDDITINAVTSTDESEKSKSESLFHLPTEIILSIAEFLDHVSLCRLARTSKTMYKICRLNFIWYQLMKRTYPQTPCPKHPIQKSMRETKYYSSQDYYTVYSKRVDLEKKYLYKQHGSFISWVIGSKTRENIFSIKDEFCKVQLDLGFMEDVVFEEFCRALLIYPQLCLLPLKLVGFACLPIISFFRIFLMPNQGALIRRVTISQWRFRLLQAVSGFRMNFMNSHRYAILAIFTCLLIMYEAIAEIISTVNYIVVFVMTLGAPLWLNRGNDQENINNQAIGNAGFGHRHDMSWNQYQGLSRVRNLTLRRAIFVWQNILNPLILLLQLEFFFFPYSLLTGSSLTSTLFFNKSNSSTMQNYPIGLSPEEHQFNPFQQPTCYPNSQHAHYVINESRIYESFNLNGIMPLQFLWFPVILVSEEMTWSKCRNFVTLGDPLLFTTLAMISLGLFQLPFFLAMEIMRSTSAVLMRSILFITDGT